MDKVDQFIKDPKKALWKLALPMIVATLIQTLYNIVDTAYVGRLGEESLAAITFSWPLFFILIAINAGINTGMTSRIARYLGEKKQEHAENAAMHGLILISITAVFSAVFGIIFLEPIFSLFGATGNVLTLAKDYMTIVLAGIIFMFLSYVYNGIFSAQGNTKTPMKIMIISTIVNVILDPFFIFPEVFGIPGLDLGIQGAAFATVLSFFVALVIFMTSTKKVSTLHIHLKNFHFNPKILKDIFAVGMPSSFTMVIISVYIMFLNRVLITFGTSYVAMFGIVSRLESVGIMPVVGIAMATLTLVGMFFGAMRYDLVKEISWYAIKSSIYITLGVGAVFFIIPSFFLRIFTNQANILAIGAPYLRLDVITFPLMALTMLPARIMQALGKGYPGMIFQIIRVFLVSIPLAYLFTFVFNFGYLSVATAMILGGGASSLVALIWLGLEFKRMQKKHN